MYEKYHEKGLEVLDIPCNQFAGQTPGTDEEIHEFCTLHYNTRFPQMKKSEKAMLKKADKDYEKKPDIKWNFTKFVVDREGNVVARFEPTAKMEDVAKFVGELVEA